MPTPKIMFEQGRDDSIVLATMAAVDGPITSSIIEGLESWFGDVEVKYPIAEMVFADGERLNLLNGVAEELAEFFDEAYKQCDEEGLDDELFAKLATNVDPLWREITGLLAPELNRRFERQRIPEDHVSEVSNAIKESLTQGDDEEGMSVSERLIKDRSLRTHLRRIGLDPDRM
jgi:hypothetical protein